MPKLAGSNSPAVSGKYTSFFLFCSLYQATRFDIAWVCSGSQNPKQISQGSMPPNPPRSLLFRRSFMKSVSGYPRSASGTLYLRGLQWSVMKWSTHNLFISISFSATFFRSSHLKLPLISLLCPSFNSNSKYFNFSN